MTIAKQEAVNLFDLNDDFEIEAIEALKAYFELMFFGN